MSEVWLVVDEWVDASGEIVTASAATTKIVEALKQAIEASPTLTIAPSGNSQLKERLKVRVVSSKTLGSVSTPTKSDRIDVESEESTNFLLCPLTLDLPAALQFPAQADSLLDEDGRDVVSIVSSSYQPFHLLALTSLPDSRQN